MGKCSKDKRDIYYRLGKSEGYRARSAYKLIHLDEQYGLFNNPSQAVDRVIDLCAAPGSWSQVLVKKLNETRSAEEEPAKIVAVDLQPMAPIDGVVQIVGDITKLETATSILSHFEGQKADLVVCDGAPDEAFVVCRNYAPPDGFVPDMSHPLLMNPATRCQSDEGTCQDLRRILDFVACGDLSAWPDSDMNYPPPSPGINEGPEDTNPIAPPTEPPYKEWLLKKSRGEL
ncbi:hypothetical protein PGT21_032469 [Puccinia graminis f. sp. tritici]|uniref:Ribosomal RNA methyltransferase FtsJ domain-containing protein n=1 Tax=Puccinia graminis f. sp. tritici TaxID=56615 RepID=A0A5B0QYX0_PUCGR|nr:hypothetical protein PGT21_032469 [Puccinia graminis f. sp. tritici]